MNKRKPLQVYLTQEERQKLEKAKQALDERTLSATVKRLLSIFVTLGISGSGGSCHECHKADQIRKELGL